MTRPPTFTDARGRVWSIGSHVLAHWWERSVVGTSERMIEASQTGRVAAIVAGGEEGWTVTLAFLSSDETKPVATRDFRPSAILVLST